MASMGSGVIFFALVLVAAGVAADSRFDSPWKGSSGGRDNNDRRGNNHGREHSRNDQRGRGGDRDRNNNDRGGQRKTQLPSTDDVKFIIVGFRHGNRNPDQFLNGDKSHDQWAWEGPSQLTSIGKRQGYSLGQFLRKRYGNVVSDEYLPSQFKAISSSADRAQQTMQACMAGFYPTKGRNAQGYSLSWQPIPYGINDPLLRMYNVDPCPGYKSAYQAISDDNSAAAREWLNREPALTKYIAEKSGLNASLSDLGDVADNIGNMRKFNVPLPSWVTKPTLPGYPPKNMEDAVNSFAEAHQVLCANDPDCSHMMAGLWLDEIMTVLQKKASGDAKLKDRRANFYAAHTETVLSLLRLLKVDDIADETPTSAGLVIEFTDKPVPAVRVLFHQPNPENPDDRLAEVKSLAYCEDKEWCPVDTLVSSVKGPNFSDWRDACKVASTCTL
ncbi:putative Testicular acid phosphatase-like protein [Hypsibius exemplaris]|uniref:Testicular acid phosphatase-like protein n=1 Tax=Hypsibius exemplaris TaxID=2072580 RepID=A0A1W0WWD8_HYPEX|nr:putative Testicular acid phosphatase-like protein [Hypsibius exemplaris]